MATFYLNHESELYHYGVLGMKWGVRRYQNKDGSLTPAGQKRYNKTGKIPDQVAYNKSMSNKFANDLKKKLGGSWSIDWDDDGVKDGISRTIDGENVTQYKKKDGSYSEAYVVSIKSKTDSNTIDGHANNFKKLEKQSHRDAEIAKKVASELYKLYNDTWRIEGKPRLTKNEFINKLTIQDVAYSYYREFPDVFFDDNGLFGYHSVHVYKNKNGMQASLAG